MLLALETQLRLGETFSILKIVVVILFSQKRIFQVFFREMYIFQVDNIKARVGAGVSTVPIFGFLQATSLGPVAFERRVILDAGYENSAF
jgi:hypothetical protein